MGTEILTEARAGVKASGAARPGRRRGLNSFGIFRVFVAVLAQPPTWRYQAPVDADAKHRLRGAEPSAPAGLCGSIMAVPIPALG
jgi:hypothetical protein